MATFTETIALEDKVTPAAKAAQASLANLGNGLAAVNKTLVQTETLANKSTRPLTKSGAMRGPGGKFLPKGSTPAAPPLPVSAPAAGPRPKRQLEDLTAKMLGDQGPLNTTPPARQMPNLTAKMLKDQSVPNLTELMMKQQGGGGPENLTTSMLGRQSTQKGSAMPDAVKSVGGKLAFDSKDAVVAAQVANQLKSELDSVHASMIKAQAMGDNETFGKLTEQAAGLKGALSKLPEPTKTAAESHESMWTKAAHAAAVGKESIGVAINGIKNAFASLASGDIKGAVAGLTEAFAGMASMLDLIVPGLGQAASMAIKIAGGLVGITAGLVQAGMAFAIESAQAKQAMLGMFDAMGAGVVTGAELDDMLSGLADQTGITKDELTKLTQSFLQMGITGVKELEDLTLAAQSAIAIVGNPAAADAFTNLQKKIALAAETGQGLKIPTKRLGELYSMGLKVDDVAKKMGVSAEQLAKSLNDGSADAAAFGKAMTEALIEKGKKPLEKLGSSVENIKKKFMQDLGDMFEDIDVAPLMGMVKEFFGLFSQASPVGQVLKAGIQAFFTKTFELAQKLMPFIKRTFILMIVGAMDAYAALAPMVDEFLAFSKTVIDAMGGTDTLVSVLKGLGIALLVIAGVVGVVIGLFTLIGVVSMVILGALYSIGAYLIGGFAEAIGWVVGFFANGWAAVLSGISSFAEAAKATLQGWIDSAPQIALDFIAGLVMGLLGGSGGLVGAVANLGSQAIAAASSIFDAHSPSRVMMGIGGDVASGLAGGMEAGGVEVHGAASEMATAAVDGVASTAPAASSASVAGGGGGAAAAASGGSSGGNTVVFEEGAIQISGADKGVMELGEEVLASVIERLALQGAVA